MARFEEGNLAFDFGSSWQDSVIKFDEHSDYHKIANSIEQTKGVDFLGIWRGELAFIEVKDFRGYRIQNKERLKTGELLSEVGQKVRDSIACIMGASRTSHEREIWQPYKTVLCHGNGRLRIILWLEQDQSRPRDAIRYDILRKKLKSRLQWLGVTINVYALHQSTSNNLDFQVTSLARQTH